jgi:hypothetical protein
LCEERRNSVFTARRGGGGAQGGAVSEDNAGGGVVVVFDDFEVVPSSQLPTHLGKGRRRRREKRVRQLVLPLFILSTESIPHSHIVHHTYYRVWCIH